MTKPSVVAPSPRKVLTKEEKKRSFEEWLKIAADNKINGQNTWNLDLIDYFAELSLLREGDSINFQKASHTLDGCVKVYTSRIDSVDVETKKLLMGLVDKEVEMEGSTPAAKRRKQLANTLVSNESISVSGFEKDFKSDPLFQKTAADFDEGGAKGLRMSHLNISRAGRLIFDASDLLQETPFKNSKCDVSGIKAKFGSKLSIINQQQICPTFSKFSFNNEELEEYVVENQDAFHYEPMDTMELESNQGDEHFGGDDDMGYSEMLPEEQHELEKSEINQSESKLMKLIETTFVGQGENKFAYFDSVRDQSWAGPQFWKSRIPKSSLMKTKSKRKPKEKLDFINTAPLPKEKVFAKSRATTLLSKSGFKLKEELLLPEDLRFSSSTFSKLFLKPDFTFKDYLEHVTIAKSFSSPENDIAIDDTNNFDEHADFGGFEFDDAPEDLQYPTTFEIHSSNPQVIEEDIWAAQEKQIKPPPLMFAKTAKRVDVQKLKNNLWSKITESEIKKDSEDMNDSEQHLSTNFKDVIEKVETCYEEKSRKDISVAFCFICVLHLANENNLNILNSDDHDLIIVK